MESGPSSHGHVTSHTCGATPGARNWPEMRGHGEQQHTWKYAAPLVWEGSEKRLWYCSLAIGLMGLSLSSLGLATVLEIL